MELLYTGAGSDQAKQTDPNLSLGGFISNTIVPNDYHSSIFSAASVLAIQNKRRETKLIALKNNEGDVVTDLTFTFTIEADSICKYKVAFVRPTLSNGAYCFEKIINPEASPYYVTFQDIIDGSVFDIDYINSNEYLGIWLVREFNYDADDLKKKSCTDWQTILEANPAPVLNQKENFSFKIDYTIGEPSTSSSTSNSSSNSISISL